MTFVKLELYVNACSNSDKKIKYDKLTFVEEEPKEPKTT